MIINDSTAPVFSLHKEAMGRYFENTVLFLSMNKITFFKILYVKFLLRRHVSLYLHEPYTLRERIRGLPPKASIRSMLEHCYILVMCKTVDLICVDNYNSYYRAFCAYGIRTDKLSIKPLLFEEKVHSECERNSILFLGRIDANRSISEFLRLCEKSFDTKFLLTANEVDQSYIELFSKAISGKRFAEHDKQAFFSQTTWVYGYNNFRYNQSGVILEALYNHKKVFVSRLDPYKVHIQLLNLGYCHDGVTDAPVEIDQHSDVFQVGRFLEIRKGYYNENCVC